MEAVDFMETGRIFYIPSTQQACKPPVGFSVPLLQDMDFYFNVVTVINFLTSIINAVVITVCYRKHKDLLSVIFMVATETMQNSKGTQALKLNDNDITTIDSLITKVNHSTNNTQYFYSTLWIFLIVLLSMLTIFALNCIFILIIRPLTRMSSACWYILPWYKLHDDFLLPAMDVFLDVVHVSSGEQIRVFLTMIAAPACSLSFIGSVKISNFWLSRKGTAFSFQSNLLTSFSRPGPYNIQLLARHMDALLQIPHSSELDFITASDLLSFPYRHPINPSCLYQQIHDEVLHMMPLSDTPLTSDPTLIDSSEWQEQFV